MKRGNWRATKGKINILFQYPGDPRDSLRRHRIAWSWSMRRYDVLVWGSTGFTGALVAKYLSEVAMARSIKFAIAGRNRRKLEGVQKGLKSGGGDVEIVVASLADQSSLVSMCASTKVVLSTVGPFLKYGTPIVKTCIQTQTDYVDITGEVPWVRTLIDEYHETAKLRNIYIVPMCGFDSIPSDLGTYATVTYMRERLDKPTRRVTSLVAVRGAPSGGTLATGMIMDTKYRREIKDVFLLGGGKGDVREEDQDYAKVEYNKELNLWTAPFGMAKLNTRVVRRSNALFAAESKEGYGDGFGYREMAMFKKKKHAEKALMSSRIPPDVIKRLVDSGRLPKPGQGPSRAERAKNWFKFRILGESPDGDQVTTTIQGKDAGYDETAKMVSESAILLACAKSQLPVKGGVLTPAFAFGMPLIDRLNDVGIKFHKS